MAKIPFTKLGVNIKSFTENKNIIWNDQQIEIKQYLPIQGKLALVSKVVNLSLMEDTNFANPIKIKVYSALEIVFAYTNIGFTDKQKEDIPKLYDSLYASGLINKIIDEIPAEEYNYIIAGINETINAFYKYKNSVLGVLENISNTYNENTLDISQLFEKISDPEQLATLKEMMQVSGYMEEE